MTAYRKLLWVLTFALLIPTHSFANDETLFTNSESIYLAQNKLNTGDTEFQLAENIKETKSNRLAWLAVGLFLFVGLSSDDSGTSGSAPIDPIDPITPQSPINNATVASPGDLSSQNVTNEAKKRLDEQNPRRGVFLSLGSTSIEKEETIKTEPGETEITNFAIGYDQFVTDKLFAGFLVDISSSETRFLTTRGTQDISDSSILGFMSYQFTPSTSFSSYAGLSDLDVDSTRDDASGNTSGTAQQIGASILRDFSLSKTVQASFRIDVDYFKANYDGYEEKGDLATNLSYDEREQDSLIYTLGMTMHKPISLESGVLLPHLGLALKKQSKNKSKEFNFDGAVFSTDDPDESQAVANLGVSYVAANGRQLFLDYERLFQHDYIERERISAGVRLEF